MKKYWKEYYMLYKADKWAIQLKNNYHKYSDMEFHLISMYRKSLNGGYDYYFCLIGLQFRLIRYRFK